MAILKFVSTTGMFHSALSVSYDGGPQRWAGFKPRVNKAPFGEGIIDSTDETPWINYWATYDIEDDLMTRSIIQVGVKYFQSEYIVLVNDCVSFTADVARAVGLKVPTFNFLPYGFLSALENANPPLAHGGPLNAPERPAGGTLADILAEYSRKVPQSGDAVGDALRRYLGVKPTA